MSFDLEVYGEHSLSSDQIAEVIVSVGAASSPTGMQRERALWLCATPTRSATASPSTDRLTSKEKMFRRAGKLPFLGRPWS